MCGSGLFSIVMASAQQQALDLDLVVVVPDGDTTAAVASSGSQSSSPSSTSAKPKKSNTAIASATLTAITPINASTTTNSTENDADTAPPPLWPNTCEGYSLGQVIESAGSYLLQPQAHVAFVKATSVPCTVRRWLVEDLLAEPHALEDVTASLRAAKWLKSPHVLCHATSFVGRHSGQPAERAELWMVTPGHEYGSLATVLTRVPDQRLEEPAVASFLRDIVTGLRHVHEAGWIHGEMRPEAVVILQDGHAALTGLRAARCIGPPGASHVPSNMSSRAHDYFARLDGAPAWRAPECVMQDIRGAGQSADIYAVGLLALLMLQGYHPFTGIDSCHSLLLKALDEPISVEGNASRKMYAFVEQCLQVDALLRPLASQLLTGPVLKSVGGRKGTPSSAIIRVLANLAPPEANKCELEDVVDTASPHPFGSITDELEAPYRRQRFPGLASNGLLYKRKSVTGSVAATTAGEDGSGGVNMENSRFDRQGSALENELAHDAKLLEGAVYMTAGEHDGYGSGGGGGGGASSDSLSTVFVRNSDRADEFGVTLSSSLDTSSCSIPTTPLGPAEVGGEVHVEFEEEQEEEEGDKDQELLASPFAMIERMDSMSPYPGADTSLAIVGEPVPVPASTSSYSSSREMLIQQQRRQVDDGEVGGASSSGDYTSAPSSLSTMSSSPFSSLSSSASFSNEKIPANGHSGGSGQDGGAMVIAVEKSAHNVEDYGHSARETVFISGLARSFDADREQREKEMGARAVAAAAAEAVVEAEPKEHGECQDAVVRDLSALMDQAEV